MKLQLKNSTLDLLSTMHPAQIEWAKAKARRDTLRFLQRTATGSEYARIGHELLEAMSAFRAATAALLEFGREFGRRCAAKCGKPFTEEMNKLYSDNVINYLHVDELPEWWQSKIIDSTMRVNASDVGMSISYMESKHDLR